MPSYGRALINSVALSAGMVGQSFELDGVSAHVRIPDSPSLHFTNAMSIEGWIFPTAVGGAYHDVFSKWDITPFRDQRCYGRSKTEIRARLKTFQRAEMGGSCFARGRALRWHFRN